ncbi:hypothetical protein [Alteromonas halophila]|uniref:Uncharacterized protein n=1 Tax=Alteromonas halophila TaxID=516698 RepID=A0A918JH81_9ALTE|nr:hypothetical protein [Alteromonas halophila]GGW78575.1 hypothetical protein GCM10007391_09010 [Alteromonas halophila]
MAMLSPLALLIVALGPVLSYLAGALIFSGIQVVLQHHVSASRR